MAFFQKVTEKSTVYTLFGWLLWCSKIFFNFCSVFESFLLASLQSIILRSFSPKIRTFLPYLKKSLKKVQSIHCLDDPFDARKFFLFFAQFLIPFCWLLIRASFYALLAQETAPFCIISKSHSKKYSLYTVSMTLLVLEKIFFLLLLCFWLILLASLQSIILRIFSPKNSTFSPYFKRSLKKVQCIHCLVDPFWCSKNFLFFVMCLIFFFFWFLFRASFYAFLAQKTALFCIISKSL